MAGASSASLPDETFRSAVDRWLIVLLVATVAVPIVFVVAPPAGAGNILAARLIVVVTTVLMALFFGTFLSGTEYVLRARDLYVHAGPLKWTIRYDTIRAVEWTHTLVSAPANSLKRLRVRYGTYGWIVISPEDRDVFVAALARRVPNLEIRR